MILDGEREVFLFEPPYGNLIRASLPVLFVLQIVLAVPTAAQEQPSAPSLTIGRATSEIKIDGILDEPAWDSAGVLELNYEWFPGDQIAPPVRTECLLTYDNDNLYVAFRAHDPEPEKIRAHLMDRDSVTTFVQDDHIVLLLDTFNDQRRAFQFRVNPLGVQMDGILSAVEGIEDFSWDVIWKSAGRINDSGYVVEIALPFNQLRFKPGGGVQTWGIQAGRSYPRNVRHRIATHPVNRNDNCQLCQFNKVTGFENLKPGLNLEIAPTLTVARTDTRPSFPLGSLVSGDEDVEGGLSVRWGVTPNITLNGTVNPDFSQVEADVAQLDVNARFALFFPEKRPFFLEGLDYFATRINAVFTRTVADPEWGVKITGKQGKNLLGVFAAKDRINNLLLPASQGSSFAFINDDVLSSVVRYRRDLGDKSTVGALYAGRDGTDYENHVFGIDTRILINAKNDVTFQYLHSDTRYPDVLAMSNGQPIGKFGGDAFVLDWNRITRNLIVSVEYENRDKNFRADSGFVPRVDWRRALAVVRRNIWGEPDDWYSQLQFGFFASRTENQSGQLTDELLDVFGSFRGPLQSSVEVEIQREKTFAGGTLFEGLNNVQLYGEIQPTGSAKFSFFSQVGDTVDFANGRAADHVLLVPRVELKFGRRFNTKFDHTWQELNVNGGKLFTVNLSQLRLVYQFNVRMFVRTILQYQDIERDPSLYTFAVSARDRNLLTQLLYSYKINPQTVAFVGYSDSRVGTELISLTRADRTFFVKLGYAWVR